MCGERDGLEKRCGKLVRSERGRDFALLIFVNLLWGGTDFAAKIAVSELTPAQVTWMRFTIALAAFFPVLVRRRREIPRRVSGLFPFFVLGASGFVFNFLLNYHGLRLAPASHATAFRSSEVLAIFVLSAVLLGERVSWRSVYGLFLGAGGVLFILDVDWSRLELFRSGYRGGDVLILSGIIVEALYTVLGKRLLSRTSPQTATALALACGWLLLTVLAAGELPGLFRHPLSWRVMLSLLYLGLAATAFGYFIWYRVLSRELSHRVGLTIMFQPLTGIPLAAVFLGEEMRTSFLLGAVLILGGVYLAISAAPPAPSYSGDAQIKR